LFKTLEQGANVTKSSTQVAAGFRAVSWTAWTCFGLNNFLENSRDEKL